MTTNQGHNKREIWSVAILCALIIGNVLLYLPTHLALSESKPAKANEEPAPAAKTPASRNDSPPTISPVGAPNRPKRARVLMGNDFGSETVDPLKEPGQPAATFPAGTAALPTDIAEEKFRPVGGANDAKGGAKSGRAGDDAGGTENQTSELGADAGEGPNEAVTTVLNGNEIDIAALVKTFSKLTKRNYIVDNNVKGKVAIHLATPVSIDEALRIFESVLLLKGFTTVPMGNNTWKVITAKDARQTTIPTFGGAQDKNSDALVTQLIRLRNIQASDIQQVLAQFVSKEGMVSAFGATNAIILIDSAANIKRLVRIIEQLDVPALDQDITIIPIAHAEAKDIAEKIEDILGDKEGKGQDQSRGTGLSNPGFPRPVAIPPVPGQLGAPAQPGVSTGGDRRQLPLKVIPDERTNSIIVVADSFLTERVRALAEQLDSEVDRSGGKFYVYRLQHADAEELAQIINAVIGGEGGGSASSPSTGTTGATTSGRDRDRDRSSSGSRRSSSRNRSFGGASDSSDGFGASRDRGGLQPANNRGAGGGGVFSTRLGGETDAAKVNLEGEVTVAADPSTNSLVINASRGDYEKLKTLIQDLDVKRRQVLVEATILEVSLDNRHETGVEWQTTAANDSAGLFAQSSYGGLSNIISNPAALSDLTIAAASTGSIVLPGGITLPSQALLITALSRNSNVNVLSTPTILATDNQEAEIVVGENVPFVTSTSTNQTNLNNTFNQVDREDVGIKLRLTPQISAGDFVVLQIFVEISNVVEGTRNDSNGPTTSLRTTETMVEVKSNQMIVTGGLISDSVTESSRGVPYLQDVPVLGNLFRKDGTQRRRTNLLVFITPRIVGDQFDARDHTKNKSKLLENEIEEQQAVPDRYEVLNNPEMDNVVEEYTGDEIHPTTITPPQKSARARLKNDSLEQPLGLERDSRGDSLDASVGDKPIANGSKRGSAPITQDDEELELRVAPTLPGEGAGKSSGKGSDGAKYLGAREVVEEDVSSTSDAVIGDRPIAAADLPRARMGSRVNPGSADSGSAGSLPQSTIAEGSQTYVVLRAVNSGPATADRKLPFRYADSQKTLGLSVFGSLGSPSGRFFEVGRKYTFQRGGVTVEFVCLGKFGARTEASVMHPSLVNTMSWYTLSPQQSLGLGRGEWKPTG